MSSRTGGAGFPLRTEDPPLLTGRARFVADLSVPGMLEATIVRSPYASARILSVDSSAAAHMPGVVTVVTAQSLPADQAPIPMRLSPSTVLTRALQWPLATHVVRYVGEPVAVVVADNRYRAEDAGEMVAVRYEPLPVHTDAREAATSGSLPVHADLPGNDIFQILVREGQWPEEDRPGTGSPPAARPFKIQRHTAVPLETRGLLAVPGSGGRLHVHGMTKVVHFNRQVLARLLQLEPQQLHLIEPAVGGGFGVRGEFYPEDFLIPWLALRLQRPVRWIEDRLEHLTAANHSREQEHWASLSIDANGRFQGLHDEIWVDTGAYVRTHGVTVPALTSAMLPGPYRWPALHLTTHVVTTHKTPMGTYRGPGRFEGTFVRERLIDEVAREQGLCPIQVRLDNLIPPDAFPYRVGTEALGEPVVFDSGHYARALEQARAWFRKGDLTGRRALAQARGKKLGQGLAMFVEKSGLGPYERAVVALAAHGRFSCRSGLAQLGQGTVSMLATICAAELGIRPDQVDVVVGDTDLVPDGHGSFASRGTATGGVAAHGAAEALRDRVLQLGARHLEAHPDDLVLSPDGVSVRGAPGRHLAWTEIYQRATEASIPLSCERVFRPAAMTYPYGVHAAEILVDPETGGFEISRYLIVYDVGRAVSRRWVASQLLGGMAQGLGGALWEELAYSPDGQLLTGTLMDYVMPGAGEVPEVEVLVTEDAPSGANPVGYKGAGEGGVVGVAPALANALADALGSPAGGFRRLPLRSETVWRHIQMVSGTMREGGTRHVQ